MRSQILKGSLLAVGCYALMFANPSSARADQFSAPFGPGGTWNVYQPVFGDINWTTARTNALAQNFSGTQGRLMSVNSQAENDFGQRLIRIGTQGWIGLTDDPGFGGGPEAGDTSGQPYPARSAGWVWADATGAEATIPNPGFWGSGEPNNSGGENFGHYNNNFGWNDLQNNNVPSYIIEYPLNAANDPLPQPAFLSGPTGGMGYMDIREVYNNGNVDNLPQAIASLTNPGGGATVTNYTAPVLNIRDSDGNGHFANDALFKSDPDQVGVNTNTVEQLAVQATGILRVPTAGDYTFGVNSDDGFRLTIDGYKFHSSAGRAGTEVLNGSLQKATGGPAEDSFGTINLPAGDHKFQVVYWEGAGGSAVELYSAAGQHTGFNLQQMNLIGAPAIPGPTGENKVLGVGDWTMTEFNNTGSMDNLLNTAFGLPGGTATPRGQSVVPTIRYVDPSDPNTHNGANGEHAADAATFPFDTANTNDDNYGAVAQSTWTIAAGDEGDYTFMVYSDDQSRFRILDNTGNAIELLSTNTDQFDSPDPADADTANDTFGTNGCCSDQFGRYNLAAGTYSIQAAFNEGGGGSGWFIYATKGLATIFDPNNFQLLGADIDGNTWAEAGTAAGLALVPEPSSITLACLSGLALFFSAKRRVRVTKANRSSLTGYSLKYSHERGTLMSAKFGSRLVMFIAVCVGFSAVAQAQTDPTSYTPPAGAGDGDYGVADIREVTSNGTMGNQDNARASLQSGTGTINNYTRPVINFGPNDGHYGNNGSFAVPGNDIATQASGYIQFPAAGTYTFGVNSDDGFTLFMSGHDFSNVAGSIDNGDGLVQLTINGDTRQALTFTGSRGNADTLGQITLAGPEIVHFVLTHHQGAGGYGMELFAAAGAHGGWNANDFRLVGAAPTPAVNGENKVQTVGTWQLTEVRDGGAGGEDNVDEVISDVRNFWASTPVAGKTYTNTTGLTSIRYSDPQDPNNGSHGGDALAFPGDTPAVNDNDYGAGARTTLTILPADAGIYTFAMYTDDASRFRILLAGDAVELVNNAAINGDAFDSGDDADGGNDTFGTNGCCQDYLGQYNLAAGTYDMEAFFREGGGGSGFFLYGTKGAHTSFVASDYQLLGANIDGANWTIAGMSGGLQLVPEPGTLMLALMGILGMTRLVRRKR